ncbi:MAG: hypothetical protein DBX44_06500 [Oscillospiraceae bacterium]|nr:MAG: hypothetical protein DBX44_06500 [Oscillospiraceae bacterium]
MFDSYNDDDIKIAPEDLSKLFDRGNPVADDNIDLFLRQRANGNTERARRLGAQYVEDLKASVWTRAPEDVDPAVFERQLKLLFAYVVHRIIEDYSPNHIVANAALVSFYENLERADPVIFEEINDSAAFSLYLYLHRSGTETAAEIGKTFAGLCEAGNGSDCFAIGESAYARFIGGCAQRMLAAGYLE